MIDALIIKWFFRLTHRFRFSNYNSNLFKSIEALNRFSAHQFYTPLFTYPTFRKKKNGNDENKTLFTYSYTSLDWTKSYTFFVRTFSIVLIIITYFIISTRKRTSKFLLYRIYSTLGSKRIHEYFIIWNVEPSI